MYQPDNERKKIAKYYLNELLKIGTQQRTTLDKYEQKYVPDIANENDEIQIRTAHDYFLKLSIILEDYLYSTDFEKEIQSRVQQAKVKYRLAVAEKYKAEERQNVISQLLERERMARESHREYLTNIREP